MSEKNSLLNKKEFTKKDMEHLYYTIPDKKQSINAILDIIFNKEYKMDVFKFPMIDKIITKYNCDLNGIREDNYFLAQLLEDFIDILNEDNFSSENYNELTFEIAKRNNDDATLVWLLNTNCSNNYQLLPQLLSNKNYIPYLVFKTNNTCYLEYIAKNIPKELRLEVIANLIAKIGYFKGNINRIDNLIDLFYQEEDGLNFLNGYNIVYYLIAYGSKYIPELIKNNIINQNTVISILTSWQILGLNDLYSTYGEYLLTGKIPAEDKKETIQLALKKGNDENVKK